MKNNTAKGPLRAIQIGYDICFVPEGPRDVREVGADPKLFDRIFRCERNGE